MLGINGPQTYKNMMPANSGLGWRERIERTPGVICFNYHTLPYLAYVLGGFQSPDPYLTCPAYHSFTGRYGLWWYARNESLLLFARHPNEGKTIIIYPQFGRPYPNLAVELIQNVNLPGFNYLFARCSSDQADFMAASLNRVSKDYRFRAGTERVLDWTFPVQTLSTKDVVAAKGNHFRNFRNSLNKIKENEIRTELIDPCNDEAELRSLVSTWASNKEGLESKEATVESYLYFLKLMQIPSLNLSGVKFYKNGNLVAFEIWSLPSENRRVANNLAGMNSSAVENLQGFSVYQHYIVCKTLLNQGIEYVCIGGSETASLDRFKRKMKPAHSLELKSVAILPALSGQAY